MNLNHLRVFHSVAQAGSISAAARRLKVSQPAVSKQLSEFEDQLGFALFDRLPRGVRLTPAGRQMAAEAQSLFRVEEQVERLAQTLGRSPEEHLRVAASSTIGAYLVPRVFGVLRRIRPEVRLTLEIGNTKQVDELVLADNVDLGLTEGLHVSEGLHAHPFSEDELVAVAAPADPILLEERPSLSAFLSRPLISRERGSGTREVVEQALGELGHTIEPLLELGSTEAVKNAVRHQLGVAFTSTLAVDLELGSARLRQVKLCDFSLRRSLRVVHLPHRALTRVAAELVELLERPAAQKGAMEYSI